jgi:hypothetical protein
MVKASFITVFGKIQKKDPPSLSAGRRGKLFKYANTTSTRCLPITRQAATT